MPSSNTQRHKIPPRRLPSATIALLLLLPAIGCQQAIGVGPKGESSSTNTVIKPSDNPAPIGVSNSYLAAAARDLLGADVELLVLAEPGMCPGHFDLRPSQVRQLRACPLLVRFDFQQSLDARLAAGAGNGLAIVSITVPGGMCVPESYVSACRQLADTFVEQGHLTRVDADRQLESISQRIAHLQTWIQQQMSEARLIDAPVLCSGHQKAFCRALGLSPVASFSAADTARPSQINRAIEAGEEAEVKWIVANLTEGRQLADALANRLGAKVVVFGNFPKGHGPHAFDELVRRNVTSLVETAR